MWSTESVICTESPKNKDSRRRGGGWGQRKKKKKERPHYKCEKEVTTVMGPVSPSPNTFHSDCSVRLGQCGKNPALQAEAVWNSRQEGVAALRGIAVEFRLTKRSSSRMTERGGCEMVPEVSAQHGRLLGDFTGSSQLLASWREYPWFLVALLQIWWIPVVDARPAPRWLLRFHI